MWDYIRDDFLSFFGALSLTGGLIGGTLYLIKRWINQLFSKNAAKYNAQLNSEIESLKHEYQKNYKDFDLYTSKKHEKYPELLKNIETALGGIMGLRGMVNRLNFKNVDAADIELYLTKLEFTNSDKNEILALWSTNKEVAIRKIEERKKYIDYYEAEQKWVDANNFFIFNQLFFSEEASIETRETLNVLFEYWNHLNPSFGIPERDERERMEELRNVLIPVRRDKLKLILKNELIKSFSK
ncbi:hypothetical protein NSQ29_01365 [Paenibacillus sp. FSL F4-0236]|uniref:hypothetical protein n=1 Tax=Paenibacillus sp. FSL F4-0236 TaxID=2954731 RepID=UPI0030F8D8A5